MIYLEYTCIDDTEEYKGKEITRERAVQIFGRNHWDFWHLEGKAFRLKTMFGWVEARHKNGLCPAPGFYGLCE